MAPTGSKPLISLIVAMDRNRLMGQDNHLPWLLPADMRYFKATTMGHPVIMGRKTWEAIGRPLPGRRNIVLTRESGYRAPGAEVVHSVREALQLIEEGECFVIGGAEVFRAFLPEADCLYITVIDHEFRGQTYFPPLNEQEWELISRREGQTDEQNPYPHRYLIYKRREHN